MHLTTFRDVAIGQSFDFIDDKAPAGYNTFFHRCEKISERRYQWVERGETIKTTIGNINVVVFHIGD